MRRLLPILLLLSGCAQTAAAVDCQAEAAELRGFGLRAEHTYVKPAVQVEEPHDPAPNLCTRLLSEYRELAGLCAIEEAATAREGQQCQPQTCPECVKYIAKRTEAQEAGCL